LKEFENYKELCVPVGPCISVRLYRPEASQLNCPSP